MPKDSKNTKSKKAPKGVALLIPEPEQQNYAAPPDVTIEGAISDLMTEVGCTWGVDENSLPAALQLVCDRIVELKGGATMAEDAAAPDSSHVKAETLADVMGANSRMRDHLLEELARSRNIVFRVKTAMQLDRCDEDGTEILERVNRHATLAHYIKRRIADARGEQRHDVVAELSSLMAHVMSTAEHAAWLKGKPQAVVTEVVLQTVGQPLPTTRWEILPTDAALIAKALQLMSDGAINGHPRALALSALFFRIADSAVANAELVNLMRLIVIPILVRQESAAGGGEG